MSDNIQNKIKIPIGVWVCLGLAVLFQLSVIGMMFARANAIKKFAESNKTIIRIRCSAADPFNPFKGRYVHLLLNQDDIKMNEEKLGFDFSKLQKNCSDYYMQENYAREVDKISWRDFNELNPVLELYVGEDGKGIQKALYVNDNVEIEDFIKNKLEEQASK